ncbi:MAG: hypothetical protein V4463_19185 [Pseudomonadota bacterium]
MIALILGLASAMAYLWRRQWIDAVLAALAGVALAGLLGNYLMPSAVAPAVPVIAGDGLRAAQWQDLPARPIQWSAPASPVLRLAFPRQLELGRFFHLTIEGQPEKTRLQLLAENGQVLAESAGNTVQWLPPVAEALVLTARVQDSAGKMVFQGPVPLLVRDSAPLQVQGRFGAPSFDARTLNELLANSNAIVDWQVTLGKSLTRSETARTAVSPNLLVIDAAWFEHTNGAARAALLTQVAGGTPLLVLGASASDTGLWAHELQLELKAAPENREVATPLIMNSAAFLPAGGAWALTGKQVWTRNWQKGRIVWLGLADWHRYAISEPQALGLWWQGILDQAGVQRTEDIVWQQPEGMPLPGERLDVCAQGAKGTVTFPDLGQTLAWQRRTDKADASCVAVWPRTPGWLKMEGNAIYVYAPGDWPQWQSAQRRDATKDYLARTPARADMLAAPVPAWPFALVFAGAMVGLWWRERR